MLKVLSFLLFFLFYSIFRIRLLSFLHVSEGVAFIPGKFGTHLRSLWYHRTLFECGTNLRVEWMSVIKSREARIGNNVYVGPFCWIAFVSIRDNVMIGGHVNILSGNSQHRFDRSDIPIIEQKGTFRQIIIGSDVWIGNGSIVMEDVESGTVVGAGSVVTKKFPPKSVIAGVPAIRLKTRG